MKKIEYYAVLASYANELKIMVFSIFNDKPHLLFKNQLFTGDVATFTSEYELKKMALIINQQLEEFEKKNDIIFKNIIPIIDVKSYYGLEKGFVSNFKEEHEFTFSDIDLIMKKGLSIEVEKPMYVVSGYMPKRILIDDQPVQGAIGRKGRKIEVKGELVIVDYDSYYPIEKIIGFSKYEIDNCLVIPYMYRYLEFMEKGNAIVEFYGDKTKINVKTQDGFHNYSVTFGIGHVFEKVYVKLVKKYDSNESEKALRFLQKNFCLKMLKYDINITENIKVNEVINLFNEQANDYIRVLIKQLKIQRIELNKIYCKTIDYSSEEWMNVLQGAFDFEVEKLKLPKYNNTQKDDLIIDFCVTKIKEVKKY